jgi:hypothetical protein
VLEASEVDRVQLPAVRHALFELLCLVRIARRLARPRPGIRWLDAREGENTIEWDDLLFRYQRKVHKDVVVSDPEFSGSLGRALEVFRVDLPSRADLSFEFRPARGGFVGMLVIVLVAITVTHASRLAAEARRPPEREE